MPLKTIQCLRKPRRKADMTKEDALKEAQKTLNNPELTTKALITEAEAQKVAEAIKPVGAPGVKVRSKTGFVNLGNLIDTLLQE